MVVFPIWPSGGGSGGPVNSEKIEKIKYFNLWMGDGILMKFDVWNDIVSQSSYFKSRPDLMTLGELEGEPKILENT